MSDERTYAVYMHVNKENGKKYIGMTKFQDNLYKRFYNGNGYSRNRYFNFAIEKYGWDGFIHEVLLDNLTCEEAEYWERFFISYLKADDSDFGYNIQSGGNYGRKGISDEGRASLIEHNLGGNSPRAVPVVVFDLSGKRIGRFDTVKLAADYYGVNSRQIANTVRQAKGTAYNMIFRKEADFGCYEQLPEEFIYFKNEKKHSRGANSPNARSVILFDKYTGEKIAVFGSIVDANKFVGKSVGSCLSKRQYNSGDYACRYLDEVGDVDFLPKKELHITENEPNHTVPVDQYDLNGIFIASYSSQINAERETGISFSCISQCINGRSKTAGGYIWKKHDE